jgi:hypothetical protein
VLVNYCFAAVFDTFELVGLWHRELIASKGQHYDSSKNGLSEANHSATVGGQSEVMGQQKLPLTQAALWESHQR